MFRDVHRIEVKKCRHTRRRVAAYCRVSTDMETQKNSVRSQYTHFKTFIESNRKWECAGIFLEIGVSATKTKTRPVLLELIAECQAGNIDLIVTKSISRFSRNTMDCLKMVRYLSSIGVEVFFEKENINTGNMESELFLSLLACFAEEESRNISENVKWGIRKRFERGEYLPSIAPYGFCYEEKKLVPDVKTASVVTRIFELCIEGEGTGTIARVLNTEGIPSPRGYRWSHSAVRKILLNPVYVGDLVFQKTYTDDEYKVRPNCGELDTFRINGHHPPIVSREEFEYAAAMLRRNRKQAETCTQT